MNVQDHAHHAINERRRKSPRFLYKTLCHVDVSYPGGPDYRAVVSPGEWRAMEKVQAAGRGGAFRFRLAYRTTVKEWHVPFRVHP